MNIQNSSGWSKAVIKYMIAIEIKNNPVGVKKVCWITMSPKREKGICTFNAHLFERYVTATTYSQKTISPTNDGKEGRSHEECIQNTHNASNGYLGIRLG